MRPSRVRWREGVRDTSAKSTILQRVGAGDRDAVAECLRQYGGLVASIVRRSVRADEFDDAIQDVFVALWRGASRFDPARASEVTFVAMIARRRVIDRLRAEGRRPALEPIDERSAKLGLQDEASASPERALDVQRARAALSELPEERRRVLELAVEGYSHAEIAESTGLPLGTVKSHARRGLIRVREILLGGGAA